MKKCQLLLLLSLLASPFLFAQHQITGIVLDEKKEPIYFATVALYQQDSTLVNGVSTDEDGSFILSKIKNGQYYIEVRMLGYQTATRKNIEFPTTINQPLQFTLVEDAATLVTAEVTAKAPLLEQKADRLVVHVADNVTSLNGSLLDVMKKVPGVLVIGDRLQMAGQQNVTILLNGRTTKYMDVQSLLKDMPGDNIQRVEVIHQPGAEFDAEGTGPIINIILKKNSLFGTNGSFEIGLAKGEDWKYRTGLSLSHYQGKMNIHGRIGWRDYPYFSQNNITRQVGEDIYDQVSIDPYTNQSFSANLGVDWDVSQRQRIGFSSRYIDWSLDNVITNTTTIDFADPSLTDLRLLSLNTQTDSWKQRTINPYYRFEIDTAGRKIDFDINIVRIYRDGENLLTSDETNLGERFFSQQYLQPGETTILTSQLDYTHPISNALTFQVGVKYSDASLDNNLIANEENEQGQWENNPLQSNHFLFDESIKAAYTKLTFNKDKWSGTLGLRYEDSESIGYSITLDSTLRRDIEKLFPSASLSRKITDELGATIAYSYRIDRPRYSNLNPFVYYLDPFTYEQGNPSLAPALTHSTKFNLTFENQPFFNVEYKDTKNAMVEVTEQNDLTGEANLTTVNLESFKNWNISLFFPLDFIPKVSGFGGVIANYGAYNSSYLDELLVRSKWDYTGFLQAEFKLPADINTEVTAWYNSGGQEGIINASWLYGVDIGLSKKFLDDKAKVSFGIENLFARYLHADIIYANMDVKMYNRWDGPVYNMQFSYKFGNQHLKNSKKRNSSASEELNRAQRD